MDGAPYHMRPWDEVLGQVNEVEEVEGYCLALIGKIPVSLPLELTPKLKELQSQKIGILRTEQDFRLRVIQGGP